MHSRHWRAQRAISNFSSEHRTTCSLCPVSYTHLDVYKRQLLRSLRGRRGRGGLRLLQPPQSLESVIHLLKIRCSKSTGFFYQCNLVTEKDFVLRYDKATIKKEVANMKIKLNPDQEIVNTIREGLKRTGGYCPCRRERTEATKCMCQEFKDQIADPLFEGFCHCMLYYKSLQD